MNTTRTENRRGGNSGQEMSTESWKVETEWQLMGGLGKTANLMPTRRKQCCASEPQKDSGIRGASYIRRQGWVGLKIGSMMYLQSI